MLLKEGSSPWVNLSIKYMAKKLEMLDKEKRMA